VKLSVSVYICSICVNMNIIYELVYSVYTPESFLYDTLLDLDTDPGDPLTG